ncbi:hypothetical protein CAEBREN_08674 [Caenorhabditis brenneri]|uniref:F-box domain-containing protein n=1 Tax=Caenorhabditis brenneri TaxID=135651 RepID=G0P3G3_CAEBE|nr:hypothetical protein CAEBREN_08674 [Caenorhabditis brenneri]
MSDVFQTNEIAYRACILYEAVRKTPIEEAYKNMKEVKPTMEYSDFEYWYYRFSDGNHDLTHGFSDMPLEVADNIVGYLGLVDKLAARKVCRNMRAVIDEQASRFGGEVEISITGKDCKIHYLSEEIKYSAQENGNYLLETPRKTMSLKGDHSIAAIEEFASVITHPKWSFEDVTIVFYEEDSHRENERKSILSLNSLLSNNKIHVEYLSINARTLEPLATLLSHFETDFLGFDCSSPMVDTDLLQGIVKMDQWKKVKGFYAGSLPDEFPIESLFHARECYVHNVNITEDRLMKIRDVLFKTPTFEIWKLYDRNNENREELPVLIDRVMGAHDAYNSHDKVYRIENSKDYIQISIPRLRNYQLRIQRMRS